MPRLSDEQIAAARKIDLLSFLSAKNRDELIRTSGGEYRTVTHGSLVITARYWYWNKGGFGSASAIDYLIKVCDIPFIEAVREVLSTGLAHEPLDIPLSVRQRTAPEPKRPLFALPEREGNNDNAIRYLRSRGISRNVIERCIADGVLYESRYRSNPVCVFVGRDELGKARFATIRGTAAGIKRDVAGSDKAYSCSLSAQEQNSNLLSVFESPIDALSHMTMGGLLGWEQGGWRLALSGTSSVALIAFLSRHERIKRVVLHLDSDSAGISGAARIKAQIESDNRFAHVRVSVNPARGGKDYNDRLMRHITDSHELTATA